MRLPAPLPSLMLLLLPLLGGCNINPPTLAGSWREAQTGLPGLSSLLTDLTGAGFDARTEPPEPDLPALKLRFGGRTAYAELQQASGPRRLWRTPGGFALATEGARVVATAGVTQFLSATRFEGADPLGEPNTLLERARIGRRQVDLAWHDREPGGMQFGVELVCRLRARPLESDPATLLVVERCASETLDDFTNRFWVAAESGAVLRSEQWVGPDMPGLLMEEVAPAE